MTKEFPIKSPRKLIEVSLPLDAISKGCKQDKNPFLRGHPRGIHLWWARRPLAAARAIIFAQLVNDPGFQQGAGFKFGKNKKDAAVERARLFAIMEELMLWENMNNESVLDKARHEIRRSWKEVCELNSDHPDAKTLFDPESLPTLLDPFAGGGAIPMEAQRLGLKALASDLNPVAVLINKAMIEIPARFSGLASVNRKSQQTKRLATHQWQETVGLAADIKHYASRLKELAETELGALYPHVNCDQQRIAGRNDLKSLEGQSFPVFAWIWTRTVKSPNPAYSNIEVPLASTFVLSKKSNAYIDCRIEEGNYSFHVLKGEIPKDADMGTKAAAKGAAFRCVLSGSPIPADYIRSEGKLGRLGFKLMAVVCKTKSGKVFLSPDRKDEEIASQAMPAWKPEIEFFSKALGFRIANYGLTKWSDLFTNRQLTALNFLCEKLKPIHEEVFSDAQAASNFDSALAKDYADSVVLYLACGISQFSRYSCVRCGWNKTNENIAQAFGRQVLNMVWDFAEANPIEGSLAIDATTDWVANGLAGLAPLPQSKAIQCDAQQIKPDQKVVVSTDPPYYDNIGYADLSDYFYVWLRRALRDYFPDLFTTITVPKEDELVATPARHGGKKQAEEFFLKGMKEVMGRLFEASHPSFPITIYYAFKQSETDSLANTSSTGWVTFLDAVVQRGFQITGTWPIGSERTKGLKGKLNVLASCVVLVCRKRSHSAPQISRRDFIRELNEILPVALDEMTRGAADEQSPVAPVDLSQAIIGPGMAVFSKYSSVLEADGSPMTIRTALQLINRFLAEDDFDGDTQFCLHWFDQFGWNQDAFGEADVLARAKATSVNGLTDAGVIRSGSGKVQLLRWSDYPAGWNPQTDTRIPIWEVLHQLIRALKQGGEASAGKLLGQPNVQSRAEAARQLAYRLYTLCERKGWAEDARAYNELITSWSAIESATPQTVQTELFE